MSSIWSWERPQKVSCKSTLHFFSLILHFLISLGRVDFWVGILDHFYCLIGPLCIQERSISNKLSWYQFGLREGTQKLVWRWRCPPMLWRACFNFTLHVCVLRCMFHYYASRLCSGGRVSVLHCKFDQISHQLKAKCHCLINFKFCCFLSQTSK